MAKEAKKGRIFRGLLFVLAGAAIALSVVIILAVVNLRIKLDELGNQILYLQDTTDIIRTDVNNMEANIEATLQEEASLIEEYAIVVSDCDFASGTYEVEISVIPKEYTDTTSTSIYFGTQEYPLALDGFAFCGTAVLPVDVAYDGNVTVLFTDGDRRSTEVLQNYTGFQQSLSDVLYGNIANFPLYADGTLTVRDNAAVSLNGNDLFSFTELKLIVTAGEEEIYNYDLLANTGGMLGQADDTAANTSEDEIDADTTEAARELIGSEQEEENDAEAEQDGADDAGSETAGEVEAVTAFSTERELNLDYALPAGSSVRIFLSATTVEGYRFVYDLFYGETSETEANGFMPADDYFAEHYTMYDRKGTAYLIP